MTDPKFLVAPQAHLEGASLSFFER